MVFHVDSGENEVVEPHRSFADWTPSGHGVCQFSYVREGPKPDELKGLFVARLGNDKQEMVASDEDIANAGLWRSSWLLTGLISLSPSGKYYAVSMGTLEKGSDAIRIYPASETCVSDLGKPLKFIPTRLVAALEWSPDESSLAIIEQVEPLGENFAFEVRVVKLDDGSRTTIGLLEFEGIDVDALALMRFVSWAR